MIPFKQYFEEQITIGVTQCITIDGIGELKAKIDSGNEGFNVLHGVNIEYPDGDKVKFQTVKDNSPNGQTVSFKKRGEINIHAGQHDEMRPVIHLSFKIGDQFFQNIPFSISNRMRDGVEFKDWCPVLIGEPFLKKIDATIEVNKAQLQ